MNFCPNCGNKIIEGSRFCSNCGYNVLQETASPEGNRQTETPSLPEENAVLQAAPKKPCPVILDKVSSKHGSYESLDIKFRYMGPGTVKYLTFFFSHVNRVGDIEDTLYKRVTGPIEGSPKKLKVQWTDAAAPDVLSPFMMTRIDMAVSHNADSNTYSSRMKQYGGAVAWVEVNKVAIEYMDGSFEEYAGPELGPNNRDRF